MNVEAGVKGFVSVPLEERFWAKVERGADDECWNWTGTTTGTGWPRGMLWVNGRNQLAPRISWQLHHGEIPEGLLVCHHCDNGLCVNPSHLFVGTQSDNMQDASRKGRLNGPRKTRCVRGHEYTAENTWIDKHGDRYCKACWKARRKERQ
jgi:hypothetical protein